MQFALAMNKQLAQLLRLLDDPRRVFQVHTRQGLHQLLVVRLVYGRYCPRIFRRRIFHEVELAVIIDRIQRVARAHILQLDATADVARLQLLDLVAVGTRADIERGQMLLRATFGIDQVVALLDRAAHNLEILHFADVRFDAGLEEIEAGCGRWIQLDLLAARVVGRWHFIDKRDNIAQELHQSVNAHILAGAHAEHRENVARHQALADALAQLIFGQRVALEILLHQCLVILGSRINQIAVHGLGAVFFGRWDFLDCQFSVGAVGELLHQDDVDELMEILARLDRILHRNDLVAEGELQVLDQMVVVALGAVQLVDEEDDRLLQVFGVAEMVFRADLNALAAVYEQDCGVGDGHCGQCLTHEIGQARAVDDIQLLAVPFGVEHGAKDGITIVLFNREIVAHRSLLRHAALSVNLSGDVEHRLGQSCFSRIVAAQQGDVLDFF